MATLVGYWKLDETGTSAGTTLADSAGANPLTMTGSLTNVSQPPAVSFTSNAKLCNASAANSAISAGATGIPAVASAFSIAFWLKFTGAGSSGCAVSMGLGGGGVQFYCSTSSLDAIAFGGADDQASGLSISSGAWHHMAYTYDGATTPIWYVDGSAATTTWGGGHGAGSPSAIKVFDDAFGTSFDGALAIVGIWSGVLTPTEITALAAGGNPQGAAAAVPFRRQQPQAQDEEVPPFRRRAFVVQSGPAAPQFVPFRRVRMPQEEDAPAAPTPRRFVPIPPPAGAASPVPYRRPRLPEEAEPQYLFMGMRSATIQSGQVIPDNPPWGWPRRILALFRPTEEETPPARRQMLPVSGPPPSNPPWGWPARVIGLFQPDEEAPPPPQRRTLAQGAPVVIPDNPPWGWPRRRLLLFAMQEEEFAPSPQRRMLPVSGPAQPAPAPAQPTNSGPFDWRADYAAIIGQMFRGGGFNHQV